jgi:hypothetical protein
MALPEVTQFLESADPTAASIEQHPSLVVLFGGKVASQAERDAGIPPKTQRDAFFTWLQANRPEITSRTLLPEDYSDWSDYNVYSNLLEFEEDLAHLTAAILIFLEAPGSIAELGAFSQMAPLRERLAVIVRSKHHRASSFIRLGPLKFLEDLDEESVCVVSNRPAQNFAADVPNVVDTLEHTMGKLKIKHEFDKGNKGHQLLLALDAITLFEVLDFPSIEEVFRHFGIVVSQARIRQILFTLEKARLIRADKNGGKYWYICLHRKKTWIDYRGKGEKFNRPRAITRIIETRKSTNGTSKRAHDWYITKGGRR